MEDLEDIYALSPMQQGMLFHTIYAPESGAYFEQSVFTVKGDLDVVAFARAWQRVVDRHPILRSSFLWEEMETPHQVVHRHVLLQIEEQEWRTLPAAEQEAQLRAYSAADRDRGFDLATPPLLRVALFRIADDHYRFLFSRHHLLLDRWSRSLVLKEVFALYHAFHKGDDLTLPSLPPYGDYIAWVREQDQQAAERYWRDSLKNFNAPTALAIEKTASSRNAAHANYGDQLIRLSEVHTDRLRKFAREQKLTLNTLTQGAWAILLSRYSGDADVAFGVTMAGRPATLAGVESMVGLFINTLALRVRVPAQLPLLSWLRNLQGQQSELQQFEYSSLVDIQGWSEVPRGLPLFDSIFVFENLPGGGTHPASDGKIEFSEDRGLGSTTGYPLTVLITPATQLAIKVIYDRSRYEDEAIGNLLVHFQLLLESIPTESATSISRLPLLTCAEREQILGQ